MAWWFLAAALLVVGFALFTNELSEGEAQSLDRPLLEGMARLRTPTLTSVAMDVTALGSPTLIGLFTLVTLAFFAWRKDLLAAVQVLVAAISAPLLTSLVKHLVGRPRPTEVPRLVEVSGLSYPSGHTLSATLVYLTLAIVIASRTASHARRVVILASAVVVVVAVALSRTYLGAHYPTDTLGGAMMGAGCALSIAGVFSVARARAEARP